MDKIVVGIIGCGNIGRIHVNSLRSIPDVRLAAFCDVNLDAAEALREETPEAYATDDVARVLGDPEISAVYISTHNDTHVPLSLQAIEEGKAVFLEKPMALDMDSALRLASVVEAGDVPLMVGFKLRFEPLVARAQDVIPNPLMTVGQLFDPPWPEDGWFMDPVRGGGHLLSQGCHMVDLVCFLNASEPVRVHAEGGNLQHPDTELFDTFSAAIRFADGSVASVAIGDTGPSPYLSKFSVQLSGSGKTAHLHHRLTRGSFCDGIRTWEEQVAAEFGFARESEAFIASLRESEPAPCDHRDGLLSVLLLDRTFESIRTGTAQSVPSLEVLLKPKVTVNLRSSPIRLGIVGGLNASHSKAYTAICNGIAKGESFPEGYPRFAPEHLGARVVAAWDPDRSAVEQLARTFHVESVCEQPEELIGKVDGAIVCDDRSLDHPSRAEVFLREGIPTFIDKFLGKDAESASRIADVARENQTPCFAASALRFSRECEEIVNSLGEIGELKFVSLTGPGDWVFYGIHMVDLAVSLLGTDIEKVANWGHGPDNLVHVRYRDGKNLNVNVSEEYAHRFDCFVKGSKGTASATISDAQYFYSAMLRAVVAMIESGHPPITLDESLTVVRLLDAGSESKMHDGEWVVF
jgi:predicted dehydrogenase